MVVQYVHCTSNYVKNIKMLKYMILINLVFYCLSLLNNKVQLGFPMVINLFMISILILAIFAKMQDSYVE